MTFPSIRSDKTNENRKRLSFVRGPSNNYRRWKDRRWTVGRQIKNFFRYLGFGIIKRKM